MNIKHIQTEIDAWYLYSILAQHEEDPIVANVFVQMSEIEKSHAVAFAEKMNVNFETVGSPSWRAKTLHAIGKIYVDTDKRIQLFWKMKREFQERN